MSTIYLAGAEDVQNAGHAIAFAAKDMQRAANSLDESLRSHERFLDDWLTPIPNYFIGANMTTDILVYYGKHAEKYWVVDTDKQLEAAKRELFTQLDELGCYVDSYTLTKARAGDTLEIAWLLERHRSYEYEHWDIVKAGVPNTVPIETISFDAYQVAAYALATYPRSMTINYPALGLAGESGEVANKVKKIYRDDGGTLTDERREQIKKELGDVLWYVAAVATDIGVSLVDIAIENLANLTGRKTRDTLHGDGDNR